MPLYETTVVAFYVYAWVLAWAFSYFSNLPSVVIL